MFDTSVIHCTRMSQCYFYTAVFYVIVKNKFCDEKSLRLHEVYYDEGLVADWGKNKENNNKIIFDYNFKVLSARILFESQDWLLAVYYQTKDVAHF